MVVATMTSSGKSLCYNVPVLELLSRNFIISKAIFTRSKWLTLPALAQDQLRTLLTMTAGFDESLKIGVYDGDTPHADRLWLRNNARMVL